MEDPFPPAQPSNVVAVPASDTEMDVTWTDNSNNEDEFRIEREEAVGGAASSARGPSAQDFQHAGTVGPNVTEFHDTDLEAGKTYHYHVIACNQNDCSTPSPVSEDAATHSELLITTTNLADGVVGMAYDGLVEATGGDGTVSWGLSAGALPDGLTLSAAGAITGTPTVAGQFDFTVQVEGGGQTVTADLYYCDFGAASMRRNAEL